MKRYIRLFSLLFIFAASAVDAVSIQGPLRTGQKRGPWQDVEEEIVEKKEIEFGDSTAQELAAQEAKELEKKLAQAQREIAQAVTPESKPQDIAITKSFIANAKELSACYAHKERNF